MAAVASDGRALAFASETAADDYDIVMAAVSQTGFALQYASARLTSNREIVERSIAVHGKVLCYAHSSLREELLATVLARPHERLLALQCRLLSGRSCVQLFDIRAKLSLLRSDFRASGAKRQASCESL